MGFLRLCLGIVPILMALVLSACQLGSQCRGRQHLFTKQYIPLRATPYACPKYQKHLEKTLVCQYEYHRAALADEKQKLGDFGPQTDFAG